MKIALVGYGKMGRLIEQLAPEYGFEVRPTLDEFNNANCEGITRGELRGCRRRDRLLDSATAVVENIERLAALGVNTVVGTTGWARAPRSRPNAVDDSTVPAWSGVRTSRSA